ncbi:MAG: hypothetical protein V1661_01710 [bacterium]
MKFLKKLSFAITLALFTALPAFAQYGLNETAGSAGLNTGLATKSVPEIVGSIIGMALSLLGILFLILMLYGGYTWMTSYGAEAKITKAKNLIVDALIGLIIVLAAYAITTFIIGALIPTSTT